MTILKRSAQWRVLPLQNVVTMPSNTIYKIKDTYSMILMCFILVCVSHMSCDNWRFSKNNALPTTLGIVIFTHKDTKAEHVHRIMLVVCGTWQSVWVHMYVIKPASLWMWVTWNTNTLLEDLPSKNYCRNDKIALSHNLWNQMYQWTESKSRDQSVSGDW